ELSMDTLDYTGPRINEGSKGVLLGLGDPVRELPREAPAGPLPPWITEARVFCPGCLVLGADPRMPRRGEGSHGAEDGDDLLRKLLDEPIFRDWPLLVLTDDPARAAASSINFLWTTFTRFEP